MRSREEIIRRALLRKKQLIKRQPTIIMIEMDYEEKSLDSYNVSLSSSSSQNHPLCTPIILSLEQKKNYVENYLSRIRMIKRFRL